MRFHSLPTVLLPFIIELSSLAILSLQVLLLASKEDVEAVLDDDWDCTGAISGDILEWTSFRIDM